MEGERTGDARESWRSRVRPTAAWAARGLSVRRSRSLTSMTRSSSGGVDRGMAVLGRISILVAPIGADVLAAGAASAPLTMRERRRGAGATAGAVVEVASLVGDARLGEPVLALCCVRPWVVERVRERMCPGGGPRVGGPAELSLMVSLLSNAPAMLGRRPWTGGCWARLLVERSAGVDACVGMADGARVWGVDEDLLSLPTASARALPRWLSEYRSDDRLCWGWGIAVGGGPPTFLLRGDCMVELGMFACSPWALPTRGGLLAV